MSKFLELYKPYNDILIEELNLDWYQLRDISLNNGNGPGIYPDSVACLIQAIKLNQVQTVLEIGSGASTVPLSLICKKLNKKFISIEESSYWKIITERLLTHYKLDQSINLFHEFNFSSMSCPDLLFLDSDPQTRPLILDEICNSNWQSEEIPIIMLDDAEDLQYTIPIVRTLFNHNRFNNWLFNPIGRQDRSLLINHKNNSFNINEWFWNWKPNKVYW